MLPLNASLTLSLRWGPVRMHQDNEEEWSGGRFQWLHHNPSSIMSSKDSGALVWGWSNGPTRLAQLQKLNLGWLHRRSWTCEPSPIIRTPGLNHLITSTIGSTFHIAPIKSDINSQSYINLFACNKIYFFILYHKISPLWFHQLEC